jgi:hypothetical protein
MLPSLCAGAFGSPALCPLKDRVLALIGQVKTYFAYGPPVTRAVLLFGDALSLRHERTNADAGSLGQLR